MIVVILAMIAIIWPLLFGAEGLRIASPGQILASAIYEDTILGQGVNIKLCLSLPRSINEYSVCSYEPCLWLHPAIGDYARRPRESVKSAENILWTTHSK